jgi:predicted metal-dependent phosphoesterase TrpH
MNGDRELLLCELHAHSTWSDGAFSVRALVDLYGGQGFDVLCLTDHVHAADDVCAGSGLPPERFRDYLAEIDREGDRALAEYGLLVVPGVELTVNDEDPNRAAHALAIGLRSWTTLEDGFEHALLQARHAGAALVAAHPSGPASPETPRGCTRRFWAELDGLGGLVDRFELINRHDVYGWVAEARLPAVASGDFHRFEHLFSWKTLLPCARDEEAVVRCLQSDARLHLAAFGPPESPARVAA